MKLRIIGPGVVGHATGQGFARYGHEVAYTDKGENHGTPADLHFICTPETEVSSAVEELSQALSAGGDYTASPEVVIRSSVFPGTTEKLAQAFPHLRFWHNPEFLREATAEHDFLHADRAIIGYGSRSALSCQNLNILYDQMGIPTHYCPAQVSEMVKLVTNAYLATQLGFWQQIKLLCDAQGINSHIVGRLVGLDRRVSPYGPKMHGTSYSHTKCLSKDLNQLISLGNQKRVWFDLLDAVRVMDMETESGLY